MWKIVRNLCTDTNKSRLQLVNTGQVQAGSNWSILAKSEPAMSTKITEMGMKDAY